MIISRLRPRFLPPPGYLRKTHHTGANFGSGVILLFAITNTEKIMGLFSNLLATAKTFDTTLPITALDKVVVRELQAIVDQGDVTLPAILESINEVQQIEKYVTDFTNGEFTLTIKLNNAAQFTTAGIAFDAVAAAVETAIDVAATAASLGIGWTNGDIEVLGGNLLAVGSALTLGFTGTSVRNRDHDQSIINLNTLTGGDLAVPSVTTTASGNSGVATDEVQQIEQYATNFTAGLFSLTLNLFGADPFVTNNLAFDISAANLESDINSRASTVNLPSIIGWVAGDISVSGGPLTVAPFVLTFDGASVSSTHQEQTTITNFNLTGGTLASPAESTTVEGNAGGGPADEVQTIKQYATNFTSGNMVLTIKLENGGEFSSSSIIFNADAAELTTRINNAANSAGLPTSISWSAGDIVVTGGPLATADFTLTYSGDSVKLQKHSLAVPSAGTMAGGSFADPSSAVVTSGEPDGPTNEVQTLVQYDIDFDSGEFTLEINLSNAAQFTTLGIAFDANAATVETAINVAATAASLGIGWTNGDIAVTGGNLLSGGSSFILTYSGASVDELNHSQTIINLNTLSGGSLSVPAETTLSGGTENERNAWGALIGLGIALEGDVPALGVDAAPFTSPGDPGGPGYPSEATIRALAAEASVADNNITTQTEVLAAAKLTLK